MEEDIKVLEEFIEEFRKDNVILSIKGIRREKEYQAIENLIAENKKLKENQENIEPVLINNKMYFINRELYYDLLDDMSKAFLKELEKDEKQELKGSKGEDRYFIKQIYQAKRNAIQELLQGK